MNDHISESNGMPETTSVEPGDQLTPGGVPPNRTTEHGAATTGHGNVMPTSPRGDRKYVADTTKHTADARTVYGVSTALNSAAEARSARRTRLTLRRFRRLLARSERHTDAGEAHKGRSTKLAGEADKLASDGSTTDRGFADLLVVSYLRFFGIVVLATVVVEAIGMSAALIAFDGTMGSVQRVALAIGGGTMLWLSSHMAAWSAAPWYYPELTSKRNISRVFAGVLAVAVLAAAGWALVSLGLGRDANLAAVSTRKDANAKVSQASDLNSQADKLLAPVPRRTARRMAKPTPAARRQARELKASASALEDQADTLYSQARSKTTLKFFIALQFACLLASFAVGLAFFGASVSRRLHRLHWWGNYYSTLSRFRFGRATACAGKAKERLRRALAIVTEHFAYARMNAGDLVVRSNAGAPVAPIEPEDHLRKLIGPAAVETMRRLEFEEPLDMSEQQADVPLPHVFTVEPLPTNGNKPTPKTDESSNSHVTS